MSFESNLYEECTNSGITDDEVVQCISDNLQQRILDSRYDNGFWFLIHAASLVFFMQAGFAMLCAGSVRLKNVQNTMLKNLLDACGAALSFFAFGYAFAFGGSFDEDHTATTFIGTKNFLMIDIGDKLAFWVFQFAFAATSATIVAGTLAERCQMIAYLCYSMLLTGFVYPVTAHAAWSNNGWLSPYNANPLLDSGMIDFAGSGVVHITGGFTALFATYILGPRKGRFYDSRGNPLKKAKPFPGHSVALQMLGTFILWFGWYGFNPGSALTIENVQVQGEVASLAAVNTTLSAAAGCVFALFVNLIIKERMYGEAHFDLLKAMNGTLTGLVSITAGCAVVEPWAAVLIGAIGGLLYLISSYALVKLRIDDVVDAIPVHLISGTWGLIATGLFAQPSRMLAIYGTDLHVGWFYSWGRGSGDATLLVCQIIGMIFIYGWTFAIMFPFFIWLNYMGWFRADSLEELVGLDISYHGGSIKDSSEEIKLEYVEALNRQRNHLKNSRGLRHRRTTGNNLSFGTAVDAEDDLGIAGNGESMSDDMPNNTSTMEDGEQEESTTYRQREEHVMNGYES